MQKATGKRIKLDPIGLTAEAIICEELLGLTRFDAIRVWLDAKDHNDFRKLLKNLKKPMGL
jgi:hypothetical protein